MNDQEAQTKAKKERMVRDAKELVKDIQKTIAKVKESNGDTTAMETIAARLWKTIEEDEQPAA